MIVDLCATLSGEREGLASIRGLVWRDGAVSRANGESAESIVDLDALPRPRYDDWLSDVRRVLPSLTDRELQLPIETSRGCWYGAKHHCTFCGLNGQTMAYRSKSAARVLEDIRAVAQHEAPLVYAVDNIFDHRYFSTLLPALAKEGHRHAILYEIKSNLSRRQLEQLRDARIIMLQPGIESLSTRVLALMDKGVAAWQNLRLMKWAVELGISLQWLLLYGHPGETAEDFAPVLDSCPSSRTSRRPPSGATGCGSIRFSPLFFDADALGVGETRPSAAYAICHALPPETVRRLAYHFEAVHEARRFDYMVPVVAAVDCWRELVGRSSFVALHRGDALHLFDRRPVAVERVARLTGVDRALYLGCDAGATPAALASAAGATDAQVLEILAGFVERRWVAKIDDRFLSLSVTMETSFPERIPDAMLPDLCHAMYIKRVKALDQHRPPPDSPTPPPDFPFA